MGFDSVPAPAAAQPASEEFGAFQATPSAAAPAPASDEFADFGSLRSAPAPAVVADPFAAPPTAPQPQQSQPQQFNAFGNTMGGGMNNAMGNMAAPQMMNNNSMMMNNTPAAPAVGGMSGVTNAFGNMNMGGGMQPQQATSMPAPAANDDDFGDFAAANVSTPAVAKTMNSSDPLSKLINLDGLSKNPSTMKPNTNQSAGNQAGGQFQQNMPQGIPQPGVVSAGGSDAISSMMAPGMPQPQPGATPGPGMGMTPQMQQQQQFMMNQGIQGGQQGMMYGNPQQQQQFMMNQGTMQGGSMMGANPQQQQGAMYGNQMGVQGQQNMMYGNQMGMQGQGMNNNMGFQGGMGGQQQW